MLEKAKSKRHSASIYHIKLFYQPKVEKKHFLKTLLHMKKGIPFYLS